MNPCIPYLAIKTRPGEHPDSLQKTRRPWSGVAIPPKAPQVLTHKHFKSTPKVRGSLARDASTLTSARSCWNRLRTPAARARRSLNWSCLMCLRSKCAWTAMRVSKRKYGHVFFCRELAKRWCFACWCPFKTHQHKGNPPTKCLIHLPHSPNRAWHALKR